MWLTRCRNMSRERTPGLVLAGKFFAFLLLIVGIVLIYNTWVGMKTLEQFSGLFFFWGIILTITGFLVIFVKIEK